MWNSRLSIPKILYFLNRYVPLLNTAFATYGLSDYMIPYHSEASNASSLIAFVITEQFTTRVSGPSRPVCLLITKALQVCRKEYTAIGSTSKEPLHGKHIHLNPSLLLVTTFLEYRFAYGECWRFSPGSPSVGTRLSHFLLFRNSMQ